MERTQRGRKEEKHPMSKPLRKPSFVVARNTGASTPETQDAAMLLRETMAHLETTMRLMAQATLLHPALDESLGIEAQRLIGVLQAVRSEILTIEERHCYDD
jgi:hypothetical protein